MDHIDPRQMRADYDCWPQDDFHNDSCTKVQHMGGRSCGFNVRFPDLALQLPNQHTQGFLINEVLTALAKDGKQQHLHLVLEQRFADSPRESQAVLKHFWNGVRKVTNASHTELNAIWRQMVCNVHLLVSGEDWLAILTWGCATAWLRQEGASSAVDFDMFQEVYHLALDALLNSTFDRTTKKSLHRKLQNLPWHDVVHGPARIMLWGKFFSTGFFEQCHDFLLKRLGGGRFPEAYGCVRAAY